MNLSEEAVFDNRVNRGIHAAGILEFLSELILAVRSESLLEREGFQVAGEPMLHNKSIQQVSGRASWNKQNLKQNHRGGWQADPITECAEIPQRYMRGPYESPHS